ncbi:hypothetical protein ACFTWF_32440 [Rhodococcus sp. NPDC056960]|uniref:hypothetical protein n=1 Tax=Rhodococcus sp. NPDC056960 TaxID=3345982 RepID=UPI00363FB682
MDGVSSARLRRRSAGTSRGATRFADFGMRQEACLELRDEPLGDTGVRVDQDPGALGVGDVREGGIEIAHQRTMISSP